MRLPRLGHDAPVFTGDLLAIGTAALTLPPFPMRPAFPASEYYGGSATA